MKRSSARWAAAAALAVVTVAAPAWANGGGDAAATADWVGLWRVRLSVTYSSCPQTVAGDTRAVRWRITRQGGRLRATEHDAGRRRVRVRTYVGDERVGVLGVATFRSGRSAGAELDLAMGLLSGIVVHARATGDGDTCAVIYSLVGRKAGVPAPAASGGDFGIDAFPGVW
jgi:hypothetical protein